MIDLLVRDYYTDHVEEEWTRLTEDAYHRLELETTLHYLKQYLPQGGRILDAGGGPGRYTIELAQRGYKMVLLDMTPANLDFARQQVIEAGVQNRVVQISEGSIVDLSRFDDNMFDAVLCLGGPLSHVRAVRDRERAVAELVRVCKDEGHLFVSVMSRLSVLGLILVLAPHEFEEPFFATLRDTGDYGGGSGFTACHFFLPEELADAFRVHDVEILTMVGLEGLGSRHFTAVNELATNAERWPIWLETHLQTCTHPAVVGTSEHMLLVATKAQARDKSIS